MRAPLDPLGETENVGCNTPFENARAASRWANFWPCMGPLTECIGDGFIDPDKTDSARSLFSKYERELLPTISHSTKRWPGRFEAVVGLENRNRTTFSYPSRNRRETVMKRETDRNCGRTL
jgi:hypothetical protein